MNTAELLVKSLENEGVKYIFAVPGEENLTFLEALRKSTIKIIVTRHEQTAGFMAATVGRLTGSPGICLTTLGPGATNAITAVAYAQLGGMPTLFITGQKGIHTSKQGHFQIINTVEVLSPITKYTKQIVGGDSVPSLVRNAFRMAREERPGAVHLELPEDVALMPVNAVPLAPVTVRRPVAEEKALSHAVQMIQEAKRPLLVIGAGSNRKRTSLMLTKFIEKTGIYFVTTQMGKGVVDERHPQYLGTTALSDNDYIHCGLNRADLIINVGHDIIEKPPFLMTAGDKRKVLHINFFAAVVDKIYTPQWEVVGDIANTIYELTQRIRPQKHWDFNYFKTLTSYLKKHIASLIGKSKGTLKPQDVVDIVRASLPEDGIVTLDNGMYKIWFARNYPTYAENTLLLDNALATMGAGMPSALAVKLLNPTKKVVAVVGDGGFMMTSQDIETAKRMKLDLVIVLLRDNAYGMIKWKQQSMHLPAFALDFMNPDFKLLSDAYGIKGYKIQDAANFRKTLGKTLNAKGIHLLDVPIDYADNYKVLVEDLQKKTCVL